MRYQLPGSWLQMVNVDVLLHISLALGLALGHGLGLGLGQVLSRSLLNLHCNRSQALRGNHIDSLNSRPSMGALALGIASETGSGAN